jgi:hypothetical protein
MYVGGAVLLRNFPFVEWVRVTLLTRFRERAILPFLIIGRVDSSIRDFISQSGIFVW